MGALQVISRSRGSRLCQWFECAPGEPRSPKSGKCRRLVELYEGAMDAAPAEVVEVVAA
jgi:hypothetical protein